MPDTAAPYHSRTVEPGHTRDCVDPWTYVEFLVTGEVRPCCARAPIGSLATASLSEILHGPAARALRYDLLSGALDRTCSACGLRGTIGVAAFQQKIVRLLDTVRVPADFEGSAYLLANPDVEVAGVDPEQHFLEHGRFEGRPLKPQVWPGT